jgi:Protein of unknown function (DUF3618)
MTTREEQQATPAGSDAKTDRAADSEAASPAVTGGAATEPTPISGTIAAPPDDARQLQQEIERTREQLGETVQELVAKADVKGRTLAKATELSAKYKNTLVQARDSAWQSTPEQMRRAMTKGAGGARRHWTPLAIVAGAVLIDCLAIWQWRRDPPA